ncbi:MAG: AraC family transcriptional regulator [Gammaproteobacteria bacterium]|nr:AraC family transcriptional regulator [Gammaproteobacteria bacterium]
MAIDVLAEVLTVGQLGSKVICQPTLSRPWGLDFSTQRMSMLHFVLGGVCWVKPNKTSQAIRLMKGDVVFITNNNWHCLTSDQETETVDYTTFDFQKNTLKQDVDCSDICSLFCVSYRLDGDMAQPFFSLLPEFIHISADVIHNNPQLDRLLQIIVSENKIEQIGHSVVASRLIDVLLVYIIRHWVGSPETISYSWVTALQNPKLGPAIELIHKYPGKKLDVNKLAETVFMSRSAFSKRFSESTGCSPGIYLVRWRMDLAAKYLRETQSSIQKIASEVGYESETSFSKAFKKYRSVSPVQYRKIKTQETANLEM